MSRETAEKVVTELLTFKQRLAIIFAFTGVNSAINSMLMCQKQLKCTGTAQYQPGSGSYYSYRSRMFPDSFWDLPLIQWTVIAETHHYWSFMYPYWACDV
jgi:hypothetical protein